MLECSAAHDVFWISWKVTKVFRDGWKEVIKRKELTCSDIGLESFLSKFSNILSPRQSDGYSERLLDWIECRLTSTAILRSICGCFQQVPPNPPDRAFYSIASDLVDCLLSHDSFLPQPLVLMLKCNPEVYASSRVYVFLFRFSNNRSDCKVLNLDRPGCCREIRARCVSPQFSARKHRINRYNTKNPSADPLTVKHTTDSWCLVSQSCSCSVETQTADHWSYHLILWNSCNSIWF